MEKGPGSIFYLGILFFVMVIISTGTAPRAVGSEPSMGGLSRNLKQSLAILTPQDYQSLKQNLDKFPSDQQKAIEEGVNTLFGPVFKKMFSDNFKPSDVFTVSESIVAACDGDWEEAYEKGSGLLQNVAYFKNMNAYLMLLTGAEKLIKTTVAAWEKDLYYTQACLHAEAIIQRELDNRQRPYIPSFLIKFDPDSAAGKSLTGLKKEMMKREEAMFYEWSEIDANHVHAVDELIKGKWRARLVSILDKVPSKQEIFNHFLYHYTAGEGARARIIETYQYRYLNPLSKRMAKAYKAQWVAMIKNGYAREMKKVASRDKLVLKVRGLMESDSSGVTFMLTGATPDTDYTYVVSPTADGAPQKAVRGVIRSDSKGIAMGRLALPHSRIKVAAVWMFDVAVTGPENTKVQGRWGIQTRGLSVEDPNAKKYSAAFKAAQSNAQALMKDLMVKLGADYQRLDSRIKALQKRGEVLVEENKSLSAQAESIKMGQGSESSFNAVVAAHQKSNEEINQTNKTLAPLYKERNQIRKFGSLFGDKEFTPDELIKVLKKLADHPMTRKHEMTHKFRQSQDEVSRAVADMESLK